MMPDSVTLTLLIIALFAALAAWNHDRHLEPQEDHEPADHTDTRHDEWLEDQAIERQWATRH